MSAKLKFTDPTGPGTPAWAAFDQACWAWQRYVAKGKPSGNQNRDYKAYWNHRQRMIACLRRAGRTQDQINRWCDQLQRDRSTQI